MKLAAVLILALCAGGCGGVVTFYPDGRVETAEFTILKDVTIGKYTSDGKGGKTIDPSGAKVNETATRNVVAGAVEGLVRAWK